MTKVSCSAVSLCGGAVRARLSAFTPEGKTHEWHATLHITDGSQPEILFRAERELTGLLQDNARICARRFLMEDPSGCREAVGQKPLDGSAAAEWLYIKDCGPEHNGYTHYLDLGLTDPKSATVHASSPESQSAAILETYESTLLGRGLSLERDCIRTWFFVGDIDNNYAGLVKARRENFTALGLTDKTHYISSTGICGTPSAPGALVQMDAWAVSGLEDGQQTYLRALSNMNPTYEYGVTFERGTLVRYGDRNHLIVSGTASIDTKGNVLHIGDVAAQTLRMWDNVEAVLDEGGAGFDDLMYILVYLRNESDYGTVRELFEKKFPHTPYVTVLAPVCRPDWLIEMECMAVVRADNDFKDL